MKYQNIAIVGLAEAGNTFLKEMVRLRGKGVQVVGVCDEESAPGVKTAQAQGINRMSMEELVELGDQVDVIFDLSGDRAVRANLRKTLFSSQNEHTVIAPESVARLMWTMISDQNFPNSSDRIGY